MYVMLLHSTEHVVNTAGTNEVCPAIICVCLTQAVQLYANNQFWVTEWATQGTTCTGCQDTSDMPCHASCVRWDNALMHYMTTSWK